MEGGKEGEKGKQKKEKREKLHIGENIEVKTLSWQ